MSITRKIRSKIAVSVSTVQPAENFLWNKWLRPSDSENQEIEEFYSELIDTEKIIINFNKPDVSSFGFRMGKIKTFKSSPKHLSIRSKTSRIFFGMGSVNMYGIPFKLTADLKQIFSVAEEYKKLSFLLEINEDKFNEETQRTIPKIYDFFNEENTQTIPHIHDFFSEENKRIVPRVHDFSNKLDKNYSYIKNKNEAFVKSYLFDFNVRTEKIESDIKIKDTINTDFKIKDPEIHDHLAKLIPKIYNIELLNIIEGNFLQGKFLQTKIDLLDQPPLIQNTKFMVLPDQVSIFSPTLLEDLNQQFYSTNYFNPLITDAIKEKRIKIPEFQKARNKRQLLYFNRGPVTLKIKQPALLKTDPDDLGKLLQPEINLSEEEENNLFKDLYPFEIEGARFLVKNREAVLSDEPGLGKSVQAVVALKYLFLKREIRSALILTNDYTKNEKTNNRISGSSDRWELNLKKFTPDMTWTIVETLPENIQKEFNRTVQVYLISNPMLLKAIAENKLKWKEIKNFDCIILDDAETVVNKIENLKKLFRLENPRYLWILTNDLNAVSAKDKVPENISPASLGRRKEEVQDQLPIFINQNFWLYLDSEQKLEYDQSFFLAQSQIFDALETGNPFRVQAKVFTLLHQLKQITNFASAKSISNKTEMLMFHLKAIKNNNNQAIVFSQYDKFGTQKLVELFNQEGIKYVSLGAGMTQEEMENSVKKFGKDKSITVFLAGIQQAVKHPHLPYVPYIIYFDHWWIPVSQWQLEERIIADNKEKPAVNIFNYLIKDTIDENLTQKLIDKNLLNKNITGTLGADYFSKLITESEWLDIFNLQHDNIPKPKQSDSIYEKIVLLEPKMIVEKIKMLFTSLGYQNVVSRELEAKNSYLLEGRFNKKGQYSDFVAQINVSKNGTNSESIENFVRSIYKKGSVLKIFVITLNPDYAEDSFPVYNNLTIINGRSLGKFLQMFQII